METTNTEFRSDSERFEAIRAGIKEAKRLGRSPLVISGLGFCTSQEEIDDNLKIESVGLTELNR